MTPTPDHKQFHTPLTRKLMGVFLWAVLALVGGAILIGLFVLLAQVIP